MVNLQKATLGGGCFWCLEAVFQNLKGVHAVLSGYTGGQLENPRYKDICTGTSGHAEVVQIDFDAEIISYEDLLDIFFTTHDPTTLNQQGADRGTQYRSEIFYTDESQKLAAAKAITKFTSVYPSPIVTAISELGVFYPAEKYHHNYYNENPNKGYCAIVIAPKVQKLRKHFADKLK